MLIFGFMFCCKAVFCKHIVRFVKQINVTWLDLYNIYRYKSFSPNVPEPDFATVGFSHRLRRYKIAEHFFGRSYPWYLRLGLDYSITRNRLIRISNISATWSHPQLICRNVIKKFLAFFALGVAIALSHRYDEKRWLVWALPRLQKCHCGSLKSYRMTLRVLYGAQYRGHHCTHQAFEQFRAPYMHNLFYKHPIRPVS